MSRQGDELRRRLGREFGKVKTELVVEIAANIDAAMPVDTGWARANTVASVGAPVGDPIGSPEGVGTAESAKASGLAAVLTNRDPNADLFVSNHVPYVEHINDLHPTAAGLVEKAIDDATATIGARVAARIVEL